MKIQKPATLISLKSNVNMAMNVLGPFYAVEGEETQMEESFEQVEYLNNGDIDPFAATTNETTEEEEEFAKYLLADDGGDPDDPEAETLQQEQSDVGNSEGNSHSEKVFTFVGVFCRKYYGSQQRPRESETLTVSGNSIPELLDAIWVVAKKQVHRAVIFENEVPRWADDDPKVGDIQQFVTLQDAQKKKLYYVSSLTPRLLRNWRDKTIKIFVYAYSSNVENNSQYQLILKRLIMPQNPDRAGANSTLNESMLANELRDSHPDIEGHHSSWLLWANFISSSPVHERDRLKASKAPPVELSKFFRWTPVSEAARLQSLHRGILVAQTVNDGWSKEVVDMRRDVDLALSILQGVANRLTAMESRAKNDSQLFSAMSSATQPEETDISRKLSDQVTDCPDVDH